MEVKVNEDLLKYFDGDEMSANVWLKKYALKDNEENILERTPDDMHRRMAKYFADVEELYEYNEKENIKLKLSEYGYNRTKLDEEKIYNLFKDFKYVVPAGSVMSGLGSEVPSSLSNCWVIEGCDDSLDDIFRVCNEQSQLFKRRGGVGFDISKLRPKGAKVNNSAKYSTGAVSFMDLFSNVTNTISQAGRRGALMISIHIEHPDAKEFIEKKQDLTKVTGANISVQIGDDFMNAVINNEDFYQKWPIDASFKMNSDVEYNQLIETNDTNGKTVYYRKIKAKELWDTLIHCAWNTAEPGIIFKTKHYNFSPDGVYPQFRGSSTNPCGEIFMHEDSCRLIHVNLSSFVKEEYTKEAKIDDEKLYEVFYETTRLGDDLVDLEVNAINKILKKIEDDGDKEGNEYKLYSRLLKNTLNGRRCGVGFFGLSDMIAKLGLKFDSEESLKMINHVMRIMFVAEMDSEIDMSITRGSFPLYDKKIEEKGNEWYNMLKKDFSQQYDKMMKYGRRNVSFGTAAPTGSVAMLAHCSSGIEPVFMPFYTRRVKCTSSNDRVDFVDKDGEKFTEYITVHPTFKQWAKMKFGEDISLWNEKKWNNAYEQSPWYKSIANDINWKKRVEIQGICQERITHSISSCVVPETLIELKNGGYVYIDEMSDFSDIGEGCFKDNETFHDLVKTHDGTFEKVKSFYNNGVKDVFDLNLSNGLSVTCTSNEKFMVYNEELSDFEWKHLHEINEGDIIKIN